MKPPKFPRMLAAGLVFAILVGILAAFFSIAGYQQGNTAQRDDVLRNREVVERLERLARSSEALQNVHRERNEEAHSCILELLAVLTGQRHVTEPTIVGNPCENLVVGIPPPPPPSPTTTTTRPTSTTTRAPTTIRRPSSPRSTTATPGPGSAPRTSPAPPPASRPSPTTTSLVPRLP